jgi:arabinofuranan 3-O-arabinosyltransferase
VSRHRLILPGLAVLAYGLAFAQRPGKLIADTKVHLYVDPSRFLGHLASAWSPTADLGHVWAGQYGGYLFPMAPWFALGDALGIPMWIVHRLWLGTLLFVAAWGVVRLMEAVWERDRGIAHLAAAVLFVVNPYVTVYANRTSVALLAYAALPWLLLCINRGLRDPQGWRWPAAFALVLTATGGGVNVAVTGWVLVSTSCAGAASRPARSCRTPGGSRWPSAWQARGGSCR